MHRRLRNWLRPPLQLQRRRRAQTLSIKALFISASKRFDGVTRLIKNEPNGERSGPRGGFQKAHRTQNVLSLAAELGIDGGGGGRAEWFSLPRRLH